MVCASDQVEDAALCYPACKAGYDGIGPVCWDECPSGMYTCGALCTQSSSDCTSDVLSMVEDVVKVAGDVAEAASGDELSILDIVEDSGEAIKDFAYPVCSASSLLFIH